MQKTAGKISAFTDMVVYVEEARVQKKGEGVITKGPKTENRYREIPMSEELADRYRSIWKKQQKQRQDLPEEYQDNNLILAKVDGNCYSPGWAMKKIKRCREKGGFPDWITSHTFRHTFASLYLVETKDIKGLQKILGHSSYVITSDTYSHFLPEDFERAGQIISEVVSSIFDKRKKTTPKEDNIEKAEL